MGISVTLRLNGTAREVHVDPRALLIDMVRDLGATGARVGCNTGDCGACSVMLDRELVKSRLVLAVSVSGSEVTTIEGTGGNLASCLKAAFVAQKGFQCGYCTSGMVLTAIDLLVHNPTPNEPEIRHAISGNLCRCTGYEDIVDAIAEAARTAATTEPDEPA